MREPLARLGSQSNLAIDAEGISFPLNPYFEPKDLPILYSNGKGHRIFLELLNYPVKMMDLLAIDAPTLGSRQVVVEMEDGTLLRLPARNTKKVLENYTLLTTKKDVAGRIIDLRIPNTAYIHE